MNLNHQQNRTFSNFFLSTYVVALVPALLIIIFLLPGSGKFKIEHVFSEMTDKAASIEVYKDIDNDRCSERIILFDHDNKYATIKIENESGGLVGWWTFKGKYFNGLLDIADFNNDHNSEIYFISNSNDSIFLNILDFISADKQVTHSVFVDCINTLTGKNDYSVSQFFFCDLQQDGYLETGFSVLAGFALKPRCLYLFDLKNDSLYRGPDMDCQIDFQPFNLDKDPFPEFYCYSGSLNNMPDTIGSKYHDHSAWFMALDNDLTFIFKPVEFPGHKSCITSYPVFINDSLYLMGLYDFYSNKFRKPKLYLFDLNGKLIREKQLTKPIESFFYDIFEEPPYQLKDIRLFSKTGDIYQINNLLNISLQTRLNVPGMSLISEIDLDKDNENELIFALSDGETMMITRNDFSHPLTFKVPFYRGRYWISLFEKDAEANHLVLVQGQRRLFFKYSPDIMYFGKYLVWIALYILILGFIHIIRRLQLIQQTKMKKLTSKLAELQLTGINNQMNPHFTLNVMNTISSFIYKEEKEKAYDYFINYTKLIRSTLEMADKIHQTIEEELNFVENYLKLERIRWQNPFEFTINVGAEVNKQLPVPKMIIHLNAENALKHGLLNRGQGGKLWVDIKQDDHTLEIRIRDNGIGRTAASGFNNESTGKGFLIMDKIIDLYSRLKKVKISYEVIDLIVEKHGICGTEVRITMQLS